MNLFDRWLIGVVNFTKSLWGIIVHPYATYRGITLRSDVWETVPVWIILMGYFAVSSIVKTAAFRPFILTKKFIVIGSASFVTYLFAIYVLYYLAVLFKGKGGLKSLAISWAFTLIPTVVWFLATSILYIILPPPRTTSLPGVLYSLVYLVFSSVLFFWKAMLSYLTLRFSMRLDLVRVIGVFSIFIALSVIYSLFMYKIGIFRIPFI